MIRDFEQDGNADPAAVIAKLTRINEALMNRVERSLNQHANAFSLFQAAISLEAEIRARTSELNETLARLEVTNRELAAARDTLDIANRMKTRFFTAVGHDVLQPLHAARLTLSTLGEITTDPRPRALVGQVDHALSSIEDILKTVLDISRLEVGAMEPKRGPVALADLFANLAGDFEPLARHKGLRLEMRPTTAVVDTDALMLRRIVQNLVANAVRYTQAGRVRVLARDFGTMVRIEVWDTGPGVSDEDRSIIFSEFQRGSNPVAAHDGGLGLGLSIVQRMAELLGHPVGLMSRVGRGSCFHVSVPRSEKAAPAPLPSARGPAYGLPAADIVLIDNDANSLAALRELLSQWDCRPREAQGLLALGHLIGEGVRVPDLIIADYHLDHRERGTEAIRLIRRHFERDIPAIILTADRSTGIADVVRDLPCELMHKPVRPSELRALVSHLLS